jgi:hypothetical protein
MLNGSRNGDGVALFDAKKSSAGFQVTAEEEEQGAFFVF